VVGDRWHALKDAVEPVPVGSGLYQAWQDAHVARGWPWLPGHEGMAVVFMPVLPDAGTVSERIDAALTAFAGLVGGHAPDRFSDNQQDMGDLA
jgi:hypothetical protein